MSEQTFAVGARDVVRDVARDQASNIGHQLKSNTGFSEDIKFSSPQRNYVGPFKRLQGQAQAKFLLKAINLRGNTIYNTRELRRFWKPYLRKTVSVEEIQKICQLMAQHYREQGYVLAQVILPQQDISLQSGEVTLEVLEGILGALRVEGAGPAERKLLEDQLRDMPLGKPFNENELERYLLSIRKTPGLTVEPIFVPSPDKTGHTDLVFKIGARSYISGSLSYDNGGNKYVGVHAIGVNATVSNLIGRSKTKYSHMQSTRKDLMVLDQIRQTQLIGNKGARAYLEYVNVGARPRLPDINQNSYKYANLMFMYPLIYKRNSNFRVRFALDGQNDNSAYQGVVLKNDHVRAGRLGLLYNLSLEREYLEISTIFSKGFNHAFGARKTITPSYFGGVNDFRHMVGRATWMHKVSDQISLMNTLGMQYSLDPLLGSEEFSIGAGNYARGYDGGESSGDCGFGALTEVRLDVKPFVPGLDTMQFYTSLGGSRVRNHKPKKLDVLSHDSLLSFAGGIRGTLLTYVDYSLQAGKPLSRRGVVSSSKKWLYTGSLGLRFNLSKTWDEKVVGLIDPLAGVDD